VLRLEALAQVLCRSERASEAEKVLSELRAWAAGEDDAPAPRDSLTSLAEISDLPEWLRDLARLLAGDVRRHVVEAGGAYGLVGRRGSAEDLSTADDRSSHSVTVPLADHSAGVRDYAERFARAVVLPDRADSVVSDLALAGWLHDVGKADPRFQVWLHSGDELAAALAETPLAKSSQNPRNRAAIHRARERAGYPQGGRHEVQSLALIVDQQQICDQANDWDLVQHLVVSHHGFGRPFVPMVFDPQPVDVALRHGDVDLAHRSNHELYRIEAGVPERYWRLVRRYGWWGLAWLEAILRLADQRRSEYEEKWRLGDA
jgi:CRISPR-associated endonuclease/helicase Cas3